MFSGNLAAPNPSAGAVSILYTVQAAQGYAAPTKKTVLGG
jgi:hypothetical protein